VRVRRILDEHFRYLSDTKRVDAYRRALQQTLRHGDVVIDLGCGTGILGLLACQAGARKVYAIDRGGVIEVARQVASANGWSHCVTHVRGESTQLTLPELGDVLICDQLGPLGFDAGIMESCSNARARLLKPGACLIPSSFTSRLTPVEARETYAHIDRWAAPLAGLRFDAMRTKAVNTLHPIAQERATPLAPTADVLAVCLKATYQQPMMERGDAQWTVRRAGTLHGLEGSFVAQLADGVAVTNDSADPDHIQRLTVLLPLDTPQPVLPGDTIEAELLVNPSRVVAWRVKLTRSGAAPLLFSQSTLQGRLLSSDDLRPTRVLRTDPD